jgi:hypothetical protein
LGSNETDEVIHPMQDRMTRPFLSRAESRIIEVMNEEVQKIHFSFIDIG